MEASTPRAGSGQELAPPPWAPSDPCALESFGSTIDAGRVAAGASVMCVDIIDPGIAEQSLDHRTRVFALRNIGVDHYPVVGKGPQGQQALAHYFGQMVATPGLGRALADIDCMR